MKIKARPYLHFAPVVGGVYFSGARAQLVIRGPELLFKVADVCVPMLEAGTTEDELIAVLGTERARPMVRHMTAALRDHGMLLDFDALTVAEPSPDVRRRFAGSIAYLESVSADPYAVFAKVHAAKVALFGPPEAIRSAARGLTRAGVGSVVVADLADDAARYDDVDAAIYCYQPAGDDDSFTAIRPARLPRGIPVIPILLDDRVLVAGPAIRDDSEYPTWTALRRRALQWARAEGLTSAARPVADALVGALAAQLLFKVMAGLSPDGAAHVVHSAELVAEEVSVGGAAQADDRWRSLDEAPQSSMPEPDAAVEMAGELANRFTGLFTRSDAEEDLPQLPLSLREVEYRTDRTDPVFAWAPDQQSATVGAALQALRQLAGGSSVDAAGVTEEHWLLDGALRLLAHDTLVLETASPADMGPETFRIWQSFAEQEPRSCAIRLLHIPGLDWRLGRVTLTDSGEVLGQAWASDADCAVRDALGTALASAQVQRARGADKREVALHTDSLVFADDATIDLLRKQVAAHAASEGITYRGRSRRFDQVLGTIPFWCGPVAVHQPTEEPNNAR